MLNLLSFYSQRRLTWFLLMLSMQSLIATALFFQHVMLLPPCSLCIYQRIAIFVITIGSLIAIINPKSIFFRVIALLLWLFSAIKGFLLAFEQAKLQIEPSFIDVCSLNIEFPAWFRLDSWIPSVFKPEGTCGERLWSFLTLEMSQWMIIIFLTLTFIAVLALIAQFFKPYKKIGSVRKYF